MNRTHRYPYPMNNEHPYHINQDPLEHKKTLARQASAGDDKNGDRQSDED
ncbi:MAG: hypothetical protein VKK04_22610 [Synechococcales bacterium]|nr:hypothetical protein [Synechococcales bacterium]